MTHEEMLALTESVSTKADKMRILERHEVSRADIARFLNVRYQQVRNTLEGDKRTGYRPDLDSYQGAAASHSRHEDWIFELLESSSDGSIILPSDLIDAIPSSSGDPVYAVRTEDGIFITSLEAAMRRLGRGRS
jgi:hypothetical protein